VHDRQDPVATAILLRNAATNNTGNLRSSTFVLAEMKPPHHGQPHSAAAGSQLCSEFSADKPAAGHRFDAESGPGHCRRRERRFGWFPSGPTLLSFERVASCARRRNRICTSITPCPGRPAPPPAASYFLVIGRACGWAVRQKSLDPENFLDSSGVTAIRKRHTFWEFGWNEGGECRGVSSRGVGLTGCE